MNEGTLGNSNSLEQEKNKNETSAVLEKLGQECVLALQLEGKGEIQVFGFSTDTSWNKKMDAADYLDEAKEYANNVDSGETLKLMPSSIIIHTDNIEKWEQLGFKLESHKEGGRATLAIYR